MCDNTEKKQCCGNEKCKKSFSLEGNSGDAYYNDGDYREVKLIQSICDEDDSSVGLILYSLDRNNQHELLNKFLNKQVKITISLIE
jgi:hypothetical protein